MRILPAALLGVLALAAATGRARAADAPWEREVRAAMKEEDGLLDEAKRNRTTAHVVSRYQSRADRQPTPLNHLLLGRALYHHKDLPAAERHLRRALELEPRYWFARLGLAMVALERGDAAAARGEVDQALDVRGDDADLLRLKLRLLLEAKEWDAAQAVADRLLGAEPANLDYRKMAVVCAIQRKDWARALRELELMAGRAPADPFVRWNLPLALVESGRLDDAARRLEVLAREDPTDLRALDLLREVYTRKEDWANLRRTFERILPLVSAPEQRKKVEAAIAALKQGPPPRGEAPPAPVRETAEQEWTRVVEQSLDETSVEVRRQGLQAFYGLLRGEGAHPDASIPVPVAFFERVHEAIEPDARCRAWLMRILGAVGSRDHPYLAVYAAFALYDPEVEVRRTAAEALGEIGTPAGVVYLRNFLALLVASATGAPAEEQELNAARIALARLTRHDDVPGAAEAWLTGEEAAAAARHWAEWFRAPEGEAALLAGIRDLAAIGEVFPQRQLVELVEEPSFAVAKAAYLGLLERSKGPPRGAAETAVGKAMWPRFPRLAPEDLTETSIQGAREAVREWWAEWRRAYDAQRATGSPDGGGAGGDD